MFKNSWKCTLYCCEKCFFSNWRRDRRTSLVEISHDLEEEAFGNYALILSINIFKTTHRSSHRCSTKWVRRVPLTILITNSCFWLTNILLWKFSTLSKKKQEWKKHKLFLLWTQSSDLWCDMVPCILQTLEKRRKYNQSEILKGTQIGVLEIFSKFTRKYL